MAFVLQSSAETNLNAFLGRNSRNLQVISSDSLCRVGIESFVRSSLFLSPSSRLPPSLPPGSLFLPQIRLGFICDHLNSGPATFVRPASERARERRSSFTWRQDRQCRAEQPLVGGEGNRRSGSPRLWKRKKLRIWQNFAHLQNFIISGSSLVAKTIGQPNRREHVVRGLENCTHPASRTALLRSLVRISPWEIDRPCRESMIYAFAGQRHDNNSFCDPFRGYVHIDIKFCSLFYIHKISKICRPLVLILLCTLPF